MCLAKLLGFSIGIVWELMLTFHVNMQSLFSCWLRFVQFSIYSIKAICKPWLDYTFWMEIPNSCFLQKNGIQNLLLLICSLKKEFFKNSFLFLLISFMNGILVVCLNKKSLIKWVICLWLVLLIKITMILINLKLLI